jgi:hypothetical protein
MKKRMKTAGEKHMRAKKEKNATKTRKTDGVRRYARTGFFAAVGLSLLTAHG